MWGEGGGEVDLGGISNLPPCFCCEGVFSCTVGRVCFCSYFTGVLGERSLSLLVGERSLNFHCKLTWDSATFIAALCTGRYGNVALSSSS